MSIKLTEQELTELKARFGGVSLNEDVSTEVIVHTLSSGRIVKGVVSENGELTVSSVSSYLCG